ncbi:hypothetical protein J5N97_015757 [Dioscorea zingiberensis]|uniref:Uncharacterized protein n=1 Tax=Dioscorea zingiberensis TaxID=325984 RepID=A0A9D5CIC8_9LILI|nr:hypothetical protein J5N97_015757 [Dioscorea zingiberensis]
MDEEAKGKDDIELNLETPLPLEFYLDFNIVIYVCPSCMQSGEMHYYNTRTHMRTSIHPRQCTEAVMSLDLELNLAWEPKESHANDQEENNKNKNKQSNSSLLTSWVSMDDEEKEMIAAVCTHCHMMVMMCKASPACPNCKFVHPPPNPSSLALLNGSLLNFKFLSRQRLSFSLIKWVYWIQSLPFCHLLQEPGSILRYFQGCDFSAKQVFDGFSQISPPLSASDSERYVDLDATEHQRRMTETDATFESGHASLSLSKDDSDPKTIYASDNEELKKEEEQGFLMDSNMQMEMQELTDMQAHPEIEDCHKTVEELSTLLNISEAERNKYVEESRKTQVIIAKLEAENMMINCKLAESGEALDKFAHVVDELKVTKEELLQKLAELVVAEESKISALREAELMGKAMNMEKEKNKELFVHITELKEALRVSNRAVVDAEEKKAAFFAGIESELLIATDAALQSQEQIKDMRKQLEMRKGLENDLFEKNIRIDYLQLELKQEKELNGSVAKAASDAIEELKKLISNMEVVEKTDFEKQTCIVSLQGDVEKLEEELRSAREEAKDLNHQIEKLNADIQTMKGEMSKSSERELGLEVQIATLKSELHKGRSQIASAEAAEARARSSLSGLYLAVQQLAIEAEKAKNELRISKHEAHDNEVGIEGKDMTAESSELCSVTSVITISVQEYESLIQKAERANVIIQSTPKDEPHFMELEKTSDVDAVKQELESANATINELRLSLEVAIRRAEVAEEAKALVEHYLRKQREKHRRRRSASGTPEEENSIVDDTPILPSSKARPGGSVARVGRSTTLNDNKNKNYVPLGNKIKESLSIISNIYNVQNNCQFYRDAESVSLLSLRHHFEHALSENRRNPHHLKQLHSQILKFNLHQDPFLAPNLISSYSHCHLLPLAINVFNQVQQPNSLLFNTIIREHGHHSQPSDAFLTFLQMRKEGVFPDSFTFPFLLKACSGRSVLFWVMMMHAQIVKLGFLSDIFVRNSLIDSYSKAGDCGLEFAKRVFGEMPERDVVSWNSMVAGLVRAGELMEAREVFDQMPDRDIVSWNSMLDGYVKAGEMDKAFALFERMPERNVVSWCSLVSGYCRSGDMDMARMLFDKMPTKNLVSWTVMVSGYAEKGLSREATCLFRQMVEAGLVDEVAIVSILAACTESGLIGFGKRVHAYVEGTELKFTTRFLNLFGDSFLVYDHIIFVLFQQTREMEASCFLTSKSFMKSRALVPSFKARCTSMCRKRCRGSSQLIYCNIQPSSPDDNCEPLSVESDWRSFRARLVAGEQASRIAMPPTTLAPDATGDQNSTPFTIGDKWAHTLHEPEKGCLLVATEKLNGVHIFERTVILLLSAGSLGLLGIILNRPSLMSIKETHSRDRDIAGTFSDRPLFFGGPLEEGLFLVGPQVNQDGAGMNGVFEEVMKGLFYGTKESVGCAAEMVKRNVLKVDDFKFFDGYCGWEKEQLREEIRAGYWSVVACSPSVIELSSVGLWEEVLGLVGQRKVW